MDPISVLASITGIAGFADTIVTKTYKYLRDANSADVSIRRFFSEGNHLLVVLNGTKHTLTLMSEDGLMIDNSVGEQILTCMHLIKEIRDGLVEPELCHRSSLSKLKRNLKWPFDKSKTEELARSIERQKTTLSIALGTETWLASYESSKRHTADLKALKDTFTDKFASERHQNIFKWLGSVDHTKLQREGIALRSHLTKQTGAWFLEGEKFKHWMQTKEATLWLHGIPGSGKTVLTSTVIEQIQNQLQQDGNKSGALAYYYCDFREKEIQYAWNIVGSLLKQLAHQNRQCLLDLEDFYDDHDSSAIMTKSCNSEDLSQLLRRMAQRFESGVMIIIDGLDEIEYDRVETIDLLKSLGTITPLEIDTFVLSNSSQTTHLGEFSTGTETPTTDNENPEQKPLSRGSATSIGPDLQNVSADTTLVKVPEEGTPSGIKLLFVSRTLPEIRSNLQGFVEQTIKAEKDDLDLYVSSEIHHRMSKGRLRFNDRSLKDEIVDGLVKNAEGMFRWVACQIDHLCKLTSDKAKRNALDTLPRGLPGTYDRILKAVDESHIEIVQKTLQWIISAAEPLPIAALLEALAVSNGDSDLDRERIIEEDTLLECCSSLVKKTNSILELAHFSVKQYLLELGHKSRPEFCQYQLKEDWSRQVLALTCLTYLNFRSFDKGPSKTIAEFHEVVSQRPFLKHAALWWDTYADGNFRLDAIRHSMQNLFSPSITEQFRFWNQCVIAFENDGDLDFNSNQYKACMEATPLHWASMLALHELAAVLIRDIMPSQDSKLGTPIRCALFGRALLLHTTSGITFKEITEPGARSSKLANSQDRCHSCLAKYQGYHPESRDLSCGHDFKFECDRKVSGQNSTDCPTCRQFEYEQRIKICQFLGLASPAGMDLIDNKELTKDRSWRPGSRLRTVKCIIERGVDLNFQSPQVPPFDIMYLALEITNEGVDFVSPLLERGAKVSGYTLKHAQDMIDATLQSTKRPNAGIVALVNGTTETNLAASDRDSFKKMAECLRRCQDDGTKLLSQQHLFQTMTTTQNHELLQDLKQAVRLGLTSKVEIFLEKLVHPAHAEKLSILLQKAFHLAVELNKREIASLFLKNGLTVDRESFSIAVKLGSSRTVDLLLDNDSKIARQEDLSAAIELGDHGIVCSLLHAGLTTNTIDDYRNLPIHKALADDERAGSNGRLAIIKDLLQLEPLLDTSNLDGELPIHLAARLGLEDVVKTFLERGSPVDFPNSEGKRPTHLACFRDSKKTFLLLMKAGADINAKRGGIGGGPLHYAASYNATGCTRLLLDSGADIEQLSAEGYTPLILACLRNSWEAAEILVRGGANVKALDEVTQSTSLMLASAAGALDFLLLLLDKYPELDLEQQNLDGENALSLATNFKVVELLLKSDAKINKNLDHATGPLHRAISNGCKDIVELLLDHNANIEALDSSLRSPLLRATLQNQWEIAEVLISKGANPNVSDQDRGGTPLTLAAAYGEADIVKLLLTRGVNVNESTSTHTFTALMMAALKGSLPTIKILIENGAEINVKDKSPRGGTALLHALWQNPKFEVVEYLLNQGANACDADANNERTALMWAVMHGNQAVVQVLLAHGAQINCQETPLQNSAIILAVDHCRPQICNILLEHGADLSLTDSVGRTIAFNIAKSKNLEILKYFFPHPVDWSYSSTAEFYDFEMENHDGVGIAPLHFAAKYKFVGFIRTLREQNLLPDIDPSCGGNLRPLHWAAFYGNLTVVEELLINGADVNAVSTLNGHTALHMAAKQNFPLIVLALIEAGALVDLFDKAGHTAAALTSDPRVLLQLKSATKIVAKPEEYTSLRDSHLSPTESAFEHSEVVAPRFSKLLQACQDGNLILCQQILSMGVDINGSLDSNTSPLLMAMKSSSFNLELIAFLIDKGADIHCHASPSSPDPGRHGYQPVHYAIWADAHNIIRKLLDKGARMSDFGLEPIHIAAFQGKTTSLTILLDWARGKGNTSARRMLDVQIRHQANFPQKILSQNIYATGQLSTGTALHLAAYAGRDDTLSKLVEYGADVNAIDARGWTALHQAVDQKKLSTVRLLLNAGADLCARTRNGLSPFLLSLTLNSMEILEELILRGSDVNAVDTHGRGGVWHTLFYDTGAERESNQTLKILLKLQELGVPFNVHDVHGQTPLKLALLEGIFTESDEEVVKLLVSQTPLNDNKDSLHGNLLNVACAHVSFAPPILRPLLERLKTNETPEAVSAYLNNHTDIYGTPLYSASYRGDVEAMDLLLDAGADLASSRGPFGIPLNAACGMGRVHAIKWLLQQGAGPVGQEAMQLASKFPSATQLLTRYNEIGVEGLSINPETRPTQSLETHDEEALPQRETEPHNNDSAAEGGFSGTEITIIDDEVSQGMMEKPCGVEEHQKLEATEVTAHSELQQKMIELTSTDKTTEVSAALGAVIGTPQGRIKEVFTLEPTDILQEPISNISKGPSKISIEPPCIAKAIEISALEKPTPNTLLQTVIEVLPQA